MFPGNIAFLCVVLVCLFIINNMYKTTSTTTTRRKINTTVTASKGKGEGNDNRNCNSINIINTNISNNHNNKAWTITASEAATDNWRQTIDDRQLTTDNNDWNSKIYIHKRMSCCCWFVFYCLFISLLLILVSVVLLVSKANAASNRKIKKGHGIKNWDVEAKP